ncbi:MAG TPA: adenylosuccinate synthase [Anaerolineaceae bacterium]|nr:adenylosuccinate synthase [Anaerolineaceae bacterium]
MPLDIVIGTQWGDEGKGRIVDLLSAQADIVARYNGGDNAGHTVTVGKQTFKLHLIPSGIIHPDTLAVLGNGLVINPATLLSEMEMLKKMGVKVGPERVRLSYAAHMITPAHRALDQAQEKARGKSQIGTTGRGIGPAYTDKAARRGLRLEDMLNAQSFYTKMIEHVEGVNTQLHALYQAELLDAEAIAREYSGYAQLLAPYIGNTGEELSQALRSNKRVLAEGAQGTLLDLDFGTYPFVTSSYPTAAGALIGLGLGICPVRRVIGVTKAFQTRVGAGPFPTEVFDDTAERLRGSGANPWDEFGTTTGRPRRVGWLDGVLLRYAVRVNGITELDITKMDILTGINPLYICVGYRSAGEEYATLPLGPTDLAPFEPIYEELAGWDRDIRSARRSDDLPKEALQFIQRIEELCGVQIHLVSIGAERDQIVEML